jgi:hypothetical protein
MKKPQAYRVEFPTAQGTWFTKLVVATSGRQAKLVAFNGVGRERQTNFELYKASKVK